jgi:cytochrome c oxidase cbb3-type subunit IV
MDINILRGLMTLVIMLLFLSICISVYSKKNKGKFDRAARMALENKDDNGESSEQENQNNLDTATPVNINRVDREHE